MTDRRPNLMDALLERRYIKQLRRGRQESIAIGLGIGLAIGIILGIAANTCRANAPPPVIAARAPRIAHQAHPPEALVCEAPPPIPSGPPTALGLLQAEPATERERRNIENAIDACSGLRGPVRAVADPFTLLALFRLEGDLGAPQGLLVAAYCVEAAMRPHGRHDGRFLGDWRDGKARASGPLQLHENVWSGTCAGTADAPHDLIFAASCYWQEVERVAVKARRVTRCADHDIERVAEAAAANVRKYGFRCDSRSAHWGMMEAMR